MLFFEVDMPATQEAKPRHLQEVTPQHEAPEPDDARLTPLLTDAAQPRTSWQPCSMPHFTASTISSTSALVTIRGGAMVDGVGSGREGFW